MGEILKEWLSERLNEQFKWDPAEFGEMMKNGYVVTRLLRSYKVITDEDAILIQATNSLPEINNNWKYVVVWLQTLDIQLEQTEVSDIVNGRGSASMKLFYQLFLSLDKKDRTDFIKKERKLVSNLVTKIGKRFNVEKVDEQRIPVIDNLAKPLIDEKYFIKWQKNKSAQLKETYDYMRSKFMKTIDRMEEARTPLKREPPPIPFELSKEKYEMDKFERQHPCNYNQYSYEELLELDEKAKEKGSKNILDEDWAKNYLDNLQHKFNNKSETEEFQRQMRNAMSSYLWQETIMEEETKYDLDLAEKIMKLSHFEKQMCTNLMETKQQARNIIENRVTAQREFNEQREHQFGQYLDGLKNQVHREFVKVDLEKQRQEELHKRLYEEKIKRKREYYYEICYETMLSIIDYAVKLAYFKLLTECDYVPEYFIRQWKALYFKHQPIFDLIENVEQILEMDDAGEGVEVEEIVHLEFDRQQSQNENDFLEYHNATGLWKVEKLIPNYKSETPERNAEYLGHCVLGYAVHKLLEVKYPLPVVKLPADLPQYKSKALLRCLPDRSLTIPMQALLNNRKIHVIRIEAAINYCLNSFKSEMIGCVDINLSFDISLPPSSESTAELMKQLNTEEQSKPIENILPPVVTPNSKQTQTPKALPEEEIMLSTPAELGRYAYESLCGGESPTDYLICAIIVEYLRSVVDIEGFVIINYPNNYRQAQILEETILGKGPPDVEYVDNADDIFLEPYLAKINAKIEDIYADVRRSKLVPDSRAKIEAMPFVSYFTAYIKLEETVNILEELPIWDPDIGEVIDKYYTSQYVNYSIYYEEIDKDVLAQICKYIIGDFETPFKDFDSLFGSRILSCLEFPSSEDKRSKTKIVKHESPTSSIKIRKRKTSKELKLSLNASKIDNPVERVSLSAIPEICLEEEINYIEMSLVEEVVEPIPGEDNWVYADLPISERYSVILATIWEETERAYRNDIGNLFFSKRLQINNLVPYTRFIRDKMEQMITRPSMKQDIVSKFQHKYNEFEEDFRFYGATKIEWNCRIRELQMALYEICDSRKKEAFAERLRLILNNWTMEEVTMMANTYISCMQSELNRATLTYQLLHDFYYMLMKKPTPTERLMPKEFTKVVREVEKSPRSKQSGDDKMYSKVKQAFQEMHMKNIVINHSNNPYNQILDNNLKFGIKSVTDLNAVYQSLIVKEISEVTKATTGAKSSKKPADTGLSSAELGEEIIKLNLTKSLQEWNVASEGEMHRTIRRLQMLFGMALIDLKLFNDYTSRTFMEVEQKVNEHYLREIRAVDRLCEYFQLAVERGEKIQECLILDLDRLIIDPNLQEFPQALMSPPQPVVEREVEGEFRIGQLARLREQLKLVAPTGIIVGQSLIYLLQDFLLLGKEICSSSKLPRAWSQLEPEQIPELVFRLFGEAVCIDWRDLLIYSLGIPFPHVDQLINLRNCLREVDVGTKELISRKEFMKLDLWFEHMLAEDDSPQSRLRIHLIKQFLFELFETAPDTANYSGLLLALCKDTNPRCGFAAAVSTVIGKEVCWDWHECEPIILKMIELKIYNEARRACAEACSEKFNNILLDNVIRQCEGITVNEIEMTPSMMELQEQESMKKDKHKPGKTAKEMAKVGGKNKQIEKSPKKISSKQGNSAKSILSLPVTQSKLSKLETETYMGEGIDEATEVAGEIEGEKFEEVHAPLLDATYTVSQEVIWNILQITLPWHFKCMSVEKETPYHEQIEAILSSLANDTENGDIYLAKFLNDSKVVGILNRGNRFKALSLLQEAASMTTTEQ